MWDEMSYLTESEVRKLTLLREKIITEFTPFWELNDPAHRVDHFKEVELCGYRINRVLNLGFSLELITIVAYIHDLFTWSRYNHHTMSGTWVDTTNHWVINKLTKEDRKLVADACREHRASYTGEFSSLFSELMSSADRCMPGTILGKVNRSIDYTIANLGVSREDAIPIAVSHIKDKYGKTGYANFPAMYLKVFGTELAEQQEVIRNLTVDNFSTLLV